MTMFQWFAAGFAAVAVANLLMVRKKGSRAGALAVVSGLCAVAAYLWEGPREGAARWSLAGAIGVLLASALYESAKAKLGRK